MMMAKFTNLLIIGTVFFVAEAIDPEEVGNANEYIDTVLKNLREEPEIKKHLDPLNVPGTVSEGQASLKNIKVRGLSNLYRSGDCSVSHNNDTVNIKGEIAVKYVTVTMDYSAKALFFWIHGDAVLDVDHLAVKLDLSSTDGNGRLNSFKVANLGNYRVKSVRGASFVLNWLVKIIANNVAQKARGDIIRALENGAKDALANVLKQHKLPIY